MGFYQSLSPFLPTVPGKIQESEVRRSHPGGMCYNFSVSIWFGWRAIEEPFAIRPDQANGSFLFVAYGWQLTAKSL